MNWALAFVLAAHTLPKQDARELRPRVTFSATAEPRSGLRLHADLRAEALAGDRRGVDGTATALTAEARELWIELSAAKADLRAGVGRLSWGKLDEVQPSDVINPLDTARFFLEGRADARLPVGFVRGRVFPVQGLAIEGVLVPFFRRGVFDSLDEATSPFALAPVPPAAAAGDDRVQGGGRVQATVGRVDVSASAYRGTDPFATPLGYRRFTMLAADFETVTGAWAWRGEAAWRLDQSFDAGAGFDRRAGDFRVFGSVLAHRDAATPLAPSATNVNLIGSIERSFSRERYHARVFGVVNPADRSGFVRAAAGWSASDRVALELTGGVFAGEGDDTIARFSGRDFLALRLRWYIH